jgi:hypothetical protein
MFRNFSILLIALVFSGMSCKKKGKTVQDNIPYQTVNMTIYPNDPLYFKLQAVGGWVYVKGGVNGIIVYRRAQNSTADFIAIERTSSYDPTNVDAVVQVQSDNFTLKDLISGSTWQIVDASVSGGPAQLPLRVYSTLYDSGTGGLIIRN